MARNLVYVEIDQKNKEKLGQLSKITGISESEILLSCLGIDKEKLNNAIANIDMEKVKKDAIRSKINKLMADIGISENDLKSLFH